MLERDTLDALPQGLKPDDVESGVTVDANLGAGWGQVGLVWVEGELVVLARGSRLDTFRRVKMPLGEGPKIDDAEMGVELVLDTVHEGEKRISLSALDAQNVFGFMEGVYERFVQWDELIALLHMRRSRTESLEDEKALWLRIGDLYNDALLDADSALDAYTYALRLDLEDEEALEAVEEFVEEDSRAQHRELLLEAYERQGRTQDWVRLSLQKADEMEDAIARAASYRSVAEVLRRDAHADPLETLQCEVRAFGLDRGGDETTRPVRLQSIVAFARDRGLLREAYDALSTSVASWGDASLWIPVRLKLSELAENDLDDLSAAYIQIDSILQHAPHRPEALHRAANLARALHNHRALAAHLETLLEHNPQRTERLRLSRQLANLYHHDLHDVDSAIRMHREVLRLDSLDREASLSLAELLEERHSVEDGDWSQARELLTSLARDAQGDEKKALLQRAAHDAQEDPAEVRLRTLQELHASAPEDHETLFQMADAYAELGRWYDRLKVLEMASALELPKMETKRALVERAETLSGPLHQPARAVPLWEEVLTHNTRHEGALRGLAAHFRTHNKKTYVDYLGRLASLQYLDREERWSLRRERAHIFSDTLHDAEASVEIWERIHSEFPEDVEARQELARLYAELGRIEESERLQLDQARVLLEQDTSSAHKALLRTAEAAKIRDGIPAYLRVLVDFLGEDVSTWDPSFFEAICNALTEVRWWPVWEDVMVCRIVSRTDDEEAWTLWSDMLQTARKKHDDGDLWEDAMWRSKHRSSPVSLRLRDALKTSETANAPTEFTEYEQPNPLSFQELGASWYTRWMHHAEARERAQRISLMTPDRRTWIAYHLSLIASVRQGEAEDTAIVEHANAWFDEALRRALRVGDDLKTIEGALWLATRLDEDAGRPEQAFLHLEEILRNDPNHAHLEAQVYMRVLARRLGKWSYIVEHLERDLVAGSQDISARESVYAELLEIYTQHAPNPQKAQEVRDQLRGIERSGDWLWVMGLAVVGVGLLGFIVLYILTSK